MNVFALQVDSKLTSFVTALSEISSVTDPTYGPNSGGGPESEMSSLTDTQSNGRGTGESETSSLTDIPFNAPGSTIRIGVGEQALVVADAVVVGVDSVTTKEFGTSEEFQECLQPDDRRSVSLETSEDEMNRCDSPECRPG